MIYDNLQKIDTEIKKEPIVNYNFINGAFCELLDFPESDYKVEFINKDTGKVLYDTVIGNNSWCKCSFQYYINWQIVISSNGEIISIINQDLKDKKVLISFDSKSLGDSLAWMPYADEFRKKHGCKVVVSTFKNFLFESQYPELEFVKPGTVVDDIIAQYNIGWYYRGDNVDFYKNVRDPKMYPMQKTASDILGLDYKEIRPRIEIPEVDKTNDVCISIHSTAQAKYWNNPTGWQEVTDYLIQKGYNPVIVSNEGDGYMNNKYPVGASQLADTSLEATIKQISQSKLFIGIGSGLSWLAWACGVPVVLISGFSDKYTEFKSYKVSQEDKEVCSGCFNRNKLDAGDWNWCPLHKGTDRQFECTKKINAAAVISKLEQLLN